jgi:tetratricopeptide (TPR) repeat protein
MSAVNLARRLDREAAWRLVHVDGNAVVFARVGGPNDSIPAASLPSAVEAEERRLRLADLAAAGAPRPAWFRWLWWNEPTPGADFELGTLLLFLGRLAPAEAPLLSAAKSSPGSGEVYNNLGELYWQRELWDAALIAYRRALANDPGNQVARSRVPRLAARSQP